MTGSKLPVGDHQVNYTTMSHAMISNNAVRGGRPSVIDEAKRLEIRSTHWDLGKAAINYTTSTQHDYSPPKVGLNNPIDRRAIGLKVHSTTFETGDGSKMGVEAFKKCDFQGA